MLQVQTDREGDGSRGAVGDKGRRILALMCQPASASGGKKCSLLKRLESQPTISVSALICSIFAGRKESRQEASLSRPRRGQMTWK